MKFEIFVLAIILSLNFCLAVEINNFSCPQKVQFEQDFICSLDIEEVSGLYDLKVYITGNGSGINKIWGDSGWTRSDWYLKSAIYKDGIYEIKLKIDKDFYGEATGILRLRENGCSSAFYEEEFSIYVGEMDIEEEVQNDSEDEQEKQEESNISESENNSIEEEINTTTDNNESETNLETESEDNKNKTKEKETIYLGNIVEENKEEDLPKRVINLSSDITTDKDKKLVYESKSEKIKRYGFYLFIGLIILILIYLLFNKLKNGNRDYDC